MGNGFSIAEVRLPDFGVPEHFPELGADVFEERLRRLKKRSAGIGLDAIVVYADREHFANLGYLCGLAPRFEEALLIIRNGKRPILITGPENQGYAAQSPVDLNGCSTRRLAFSVKTGATRRISCNC
ncbi:hypothetical protein [Aliiruegeria lutimaris]|uniref:Creatinase/Prolidase N-terminal domain-containing protein n=1 Tax=Aliiruegeria lutimaris TaxID=571298 RepID=A0A1G9Q3Y6_9RHOB|nr:hypothetical protein [Aliiruegeria lutimaris]SDM05744.1 hypothetical protein SAMN04488026_11582 [Aliiruegeria lutimaris]